MIPLPPPLLLLHVVVVDVHDLGPAAALAAPADQPEELHDHDDDEGDDEGHDAAAEHAEDDGEDGVEGLAARGELEEAALDDGEDADVGDRQAGEDDVAEPLAGRVRVF